MIDWASVYTNKSGIFPDVQAVNSTGAATPDGTEYVAPAINNFQMGFSQALMDYASLTPNGVTEAAGASQLLDAIRKGFGVGPGKGVIWFLNNDPATTGDRVLLMTGQGVLRASYPDLDAVVYVGDGNNAAVAAGGGAFYRANDAAGTIPNIAGAYLILPDAPGRTIRVLDPSGAVDPDGAGRFLGDVQLDAFQGSRPDLTGSFASEISPGLLATNRSGAVAAGNAIKDGASLANEGGLAVGGPIATIYGIPRLSIETRMTNISIKLGIAY